MESEAMRQTWQRATRGRAALWYTASERSVTRQLRKVTG